SSDPAGSCARSRGGCRPGFFSSRTRPGCCGARCRGRAGIATFALTIGVIRARRPPRPGPAPPSALGDRSPHARQAPRPERHRLPRRPAARGRSPPRPGRRCRHLPAFWHVPDRARPSAAVTTTMKIRRRLPVSVLAACLGLAPAAHAGEPELLFRVSADAGFVADHAAGDPVPNFQDKVRIVPTGVKGGAIEWADDGVLAWNAPGNIQAQRGTLAFFWRPRYPAGEAPFVIFRVGYADHSSWDMVWLRIDWNGHGFDAFVTDANLARTRVSFRMDAPPAADAWTHLAFARDETAGVRLNV